MGVKEHDRATHASAKICLVRRLVGSLDYYLKKYSTVAQRTAPTIHWRQFALGAMMGHTVEIYSIVELKLASRHPMEQLTYRDLHAMLELGELSSSVCYRRHALLALTDLAAKGKRLDPQSRWRLMRFRATLDAMESNDEVEITGETMCETVMLALGAVERR